MHAFIRATLINRNQFYSAMKTNEQNRFIIVQTNSCAFCEQCANVSNGRTKKQHKHEIIVRTHENDRWLILQQTKVNRNKRNKATIFIVKCTINEQNLMLFFIYFIQVEWSFKIHSNTTNWNRNSKMSKRTEENETKDKLRPN